VEFVVVKVALEQFFSPGIPVFPFSIAPLMSRVAEHF
jgi:hypothetical protein